MLKRLNNSLGVFRSPCSKKFIKRQLCRKQTSDSLKENGKMQETFFQRAQIDSGVYQGAAMFGCAMAYGYFAPNDLHYKVLRGTIDGFRGLGLPRENISDKQLLRDFIEKNVLAAQNVVLASPSFYFMWHWAHGTKISTSFVRAFTGTIRIVPFMGIFYGGYALVAPFLTSFFMNRDQSYKTAQASAGTAMMLSGFACLEAVVELRGCGVTFAQMSPAAFLVFIPALIGRLIAGVLTQQQKVGNGYNSFLPETWETSEDAMKRQCFQLFEKLAIDKDFAVTVVGTSVFQHILNGVTFILLTKGKANVLRDLGKYVTGGMTGTVGGSLSLFARTVALRSFFCWTWNYCSSQERKISAIENVALQFE